MRYTTVSVLVVLVTTAMAKSSVACSCQWQGPFLKVAPKEMLVIRGRVLRHTKIVREIPTEMQVEVLETLGGESPKEIIRIRGDDGGLCRPYVREFPVGTEWVLGLSAAAKIDAGSDYSISVCGTYWVRVLGRVVQGNVDDEKHQLAVQQVSLEELRRRLRAAKSR